MTQLRQKLDENTLAAMLHDAALTKAKKRAERARQGNEPREPRASLWRAGVAHGLAVMEESPAEVKEVLAHAQRMTKRRPVYPTGHDVCKADALHQRVVTYYEGVAFALSGSKIRAKFFASAAPKLHELVAAV